MPLLHTLTTYIAVDTELILLAHFITVTLQKIDNSLMAEVISIKLINIFNFLFTLCKMSSLYFTLAVKAWV